MAELNAELEDLLGRSEDADPSRVLNALGGRQGDAGDAPFAGGDGPVPSETDPPRSFASSAFGSGASPRPFPAAPSTPLSSSAPDHSAFSPFPAPSSPPLSPFPAPSSPPLSPFPAPASSSPLAGVPPASPQLTHADAEGRASMVDVGAKPWTRREATAACSVWLGPTAFGLVQANALKKGDALAVARIAGIQGAKLASTLVPLCHPVALSTVGVDLELHEPSHSLLVRVTAVCVGPTGVEMEAMAGASAAALAAYDMVKGVERGVRIDGLRLLRKVGGKSGEWIGA